MTCRALVTIFAAVSIVAACSEPTAPFGEPTAALVLSGNEQRGPAGTVLPEPPRIRVLDASGRGVPGVAVRFAVQSGGGNVANENATTDATGIVAAEWTLGTTVGRQELAASAGAAVTVTISAMAFDPQQPPPESESPALIALPTYDGSGQAVHPDVAVAAMYWMAVTPYPGGNANYENPSIVTSTTGTAWSVPAGVTNPVMRPSLGAYLSDPDIVYDAASHQFSMFYREVTGNENVIHLTHSADGVHWSSNIAVVSAPSHQIVSPAVVLGAPAARWTMWAVNSGPSGCDAVTTRVEQRTSSDGVRWSDAIGTDLEQPGQVIWHIDVAWLADRAEYWALYNTHDIGRNCASGSLFLARSTDGLHWITYPTPVAQNGVIGAFADVVYRSTMLEHPESGTVTFWMSGARYIPMVGYDWRVATVTWKIADLLNRIAMPMASVRLPQRADLPAPEPDAPLRP